MTTNTQELPFNTVDSWAIWNKPETSLNNKSAAEREKLFGESYQPESFPEDALTDNIAEKLQNTEYVLVGLNPGNAAVKQDPKTNFLNFHGAKKSMDYRLAAALYDTKMWGAFMTDLTPVIESDSTKVKPSQKDVNNLESHLDELNIPATATIVALGNASNEALAKYAKRNVVTIPHYSGANGHWNAETVHEKVLAITK
ncbi:uracil-DNA glycosylase family protein [Companilactobacillus sp. HBUAS59699]|uniref:uracil-DNA glycosylase family protein n=1 Tax=Companilactobacillus sp. HBUAS59699 TaxID=3109358 RepID=UPI002FF283C1